MIEISGADQLGKLSKALKDAGEKGLKRELDRAIRDAVAPLKTAVPQSARAKLPKRGGLADLVAERTVPRTRRQNSSKGVGLRVTATGRKGMKNLKRLDEGKVRHPVRGNREKWVEQNVTPGFWSEPLKEMAPQARAEVEAAMNRVARKIDGAL